MRISDWSSDVCSSDLNVEPDSFGPVPAFKWRRRGYVRMFVTRNRHHADKRDAGPLWQLHIFAGESGRMVSLVFKLFVQCVTYEQLRLQSFGRNHCCGQRTQIGIASGREKVWQDG